ncbi:MAG TPA: C25 family cysteine peptidase [Candidatus Acidoferrales bacterium]|nr:C25 family cysteine peptidase [Candidatus Acidoferrales bacterium]
MPPRDAQSVRDSRKFAPLCEMLLGEGLPVRFPANGQSMQPNLLDGDLVEIAPLLGEKLRRGDIALTRTEEAFVLHRVVECDDDSNAIVTRGDAGQQDDPPATEVLGKAVAIEREGRRISFTRFGTSVVHAVRMQARRIASAAAIRGLQLRAALGPLIFVIFALLLYPSKANAQAYTITDTAVAATVGPGQPITYTQVLTNNSGHTITANSTVTQNIPAGTTFENITYTGHGTWNCTNTATTVTCTDTANYTSGNTTTFTLVVAVNAGTANGTVITDTVNAKGNNTGTATATATVTVATADLSMTQVVSARAVAPGATITYTETVTNNGPSAATGAVLYQQTPPNTTFVSMTPPAGWTCPTVPGGGGTGQVICTASAAMNANTTTGNFVFVVTVGGATAAGTTITNSADVTSQTTDPISSNNATTTSILVEVAGDADLAVSMTASPTPVFVSSTLTYTIQVQNLGLSAASNVTVVDTLPASLAGASATTTQGSCNPPSGGTITCNLGTVAYPLSPAITITVTGTTPGTATTLTNTAKVSTSSTDPVSSNNTVTVLTVVQPLVCATPGKDGAGNTLNTVVNAYYPPAAGVGTVNAGATSIALGAAAANGAQTPISSGDLLLIIQTQNATISSSNSNAYGSGVAGDPSGWTSLGSSGLFEFVTATNATPVPVTGGTVTFTGTGSGGGLLNTYINAAAAPAGNPTAGQSTFQVIRVPQYTSATLGSGLTAMAWNGATGGVLALDVASQLTLGGTVAVDAEGFRGGAGEIYTAATQPPTPLATDFVTLSTQTTNASKGEGIAGTQRFVANATLTGATNTGNEGYPAGSFARGAPGTAGGGATDADPTINDQNSGGGGGGNGGTGGTGGFGWNSAGVVGGFGGTAFPATTSALVMGGGGGAGTTNNGSFWNPATDTGGSTSNTCPTPCNGINSSGAAGAGIVIIRAGSVTGTGTITANGQSGLQVENDGGGGGGAGGTVLFFTDTGNLGGLTVSATGGTGGVTWPEQASGAFPGNRHGPGAGGGGGVLLSTSTPGSVNLMGGAPGWSTLSDDAYGATTGQPGLMATGLTITQTPGTQSGAYCASADVAVTNSGTPNPVLPGGNITYTQTASNNGPFDGLNATFSEVIPTNTTFQSLGISGPAAANWNCTTPAFGGTGNITCTNPDIPSGASGTATFTLVVKVNAGTASGTQIVDTDSITSGTNDPNLANNNATVVILVGAAGTSDLTITNAATPNPVLQGNNITYTVVVTNNGPAGASNVVFSESIPANTTLVSVTQSSGTGGWTCTPGVISCSIPTFASGASSTFTVVVKVGATVPSGTVITDTANVSSSTTDPNPSNNSATVNVVVAVAGQSDLAVTKTGTPNPVLAGNKITYTVVVTNNGPSAAANPVLTDTFSSSETVTSTTPYPAGWTCNAPVGNQFICNGPASMLANTSATFTFVMTVTAGTAPGTVITNTVTIGPTANDPNTANNTASTSSTVASPTQADVAIVKTASPEPVDQGTNLTYTLQITNNGPATAQNVVVSDPLPSQVSYVSASTTQGTCSQSGGTVTCNLGSVSVGGLVIVTINVTAVTFSSSSLATNTATVSASTSDPNLSNNTSTANSTIVSPTAVQIVSLSASAQAGSGVVIKWQTRAEFRNLGFHIYREDAQGRHRVDPSLIAGSALMLSGGLPQHRAKTYQWVDPQGSAGATYYVEDVDLNGSRTMHGPIYADSSSEPGGPVAPATLLRAMNQTTSRAPTHIVRPLSTPNPIIPPVLAGETPVSLNGVPAAKISVTSEGWYQVTRTQLVAAGFNPFGDVRFLQLYAEGIEQPLLIVGPQYGPLGPNGSIEFYGTGIDTPYSGTRVYWLVQGSRPGKRISLVQAGGSGTGPASFPFTVLFEQRTTYFAALLNGENNDNFFGAIVTSEPVGQGFNIAHIDRNSAMPVTMDVTLQGVTNGQAHQVEVAFNGTPVGEISFANESNVTNTFALDNSLLQEGTNKVTLTALDGEFDVSLVQSIAVHYPHTYVADGNWLRATATSGEPVHIGGFTNSQISVFDITNPTAITQLVAPAGFDGTSFGVTVAIRGATGASHTLLAFSSDQVSSPDGIALHQPNSIDKPQAGAALVVITHPDFVSNVEPLVKLHESQGTSVSVVTTDEIFDAFNFGERSPFALQSYLQLAAAGWRAKPQAVLLVGRASSDPRNYLGFGYLDFVPSRMIETAAFKTASDDWFTDFNQAGFATIPTGRLPVDTPADASLVVSKIVGFESGSSAGPWQHQALVIADQNIDADFTAAANFAAADMPSSLSVTRIFADGQDPAVIGPQIVSVLDNGALIVNYMGHGSEQQWSFEDLFDDTSAAALTNGDRLPVYLLMDCLNGYFQDVYATSLSTSLMLAPNGGAVAVWASSGFTNAPPQATMDQALLSGLAANPAIPLGKAILNAKAGITDPDVRRTWLLFGDPAMQLPLAPATTHSVKRQH